MQEYTKSEDTEQKNCSTHEEKKSGLQCLVTIAEFYGLAADAEGIVHNLALPEGEMTMNDVLRTAKYMQFKCRCVKIQKSRISVMSLPAMLPLKDGSFLIVAKSEEEKILVVFPFENAPRVITNEQLEEIWSGEILLLIPRIKKYKNIKFGFKWFLPTIKKYKTPLLEVLLAAFVMQILSIFSPLITQSVIDKVLVHNSLSTLDVLAIGLVVLLVFESILSVVRNYVLTHTTSKIDVILSCRLFEHLFSLPLRYFESRRIGDTVARVRELENIRRFLTGVPLTTVLDTMFLIVYIIILFFYNTTLTWLTLAEIPLLALITALVTPVFRSRLNEKFNCGAENQSYLVEAVTGVQTIKSFAVEPKIRRKWEGLLADYTTADFKISILAGNASAAAKFVQRIFDIGILYYGAKLVMEGKMTVGQMVAFRMLASRVSEPVMRLVQMWQEFQQTAISVDRIGDIFNTPVDPNAESAKTRLPSVQGFIKFEKVCFRYQPDAPEAVRDMNFLIRPNTIVGIVGRSGSGKSTISKLIQRLYIPERGKILIDGVDISMADTAWLRSQIGVVLQENFLFNATIRDNIALHNPAANMDEILNVAKISGAHEFISELSQGYDTIVGEKGTGLSGGQKQRIAIARALLGNPKVLIFDEATSALDYESESIIQKNLKAICRGRTVLIIAHRLSTLKDADAIMVIDKGQLAEYGPKNALIEKKGLFYYLLKQQSTF